MHYIMIIIIIIIYYNYFFVYVLTQQPSDQLQTKQDLETEEKQSKSYHAYNNKE
jgi:amino acid permease